MTDLRKFSRPRHREIIPCGWLGALTLGGARKEEKRMAGKIQGDNTFRRMNSPAGLPLFNGALSMMGSTSETVREAVPFEAERRAMVEQQIRRRGIRDEEVLEAMFAVPRHEFVQVQHLGAAYDDRPLPIGATETISQPYIVAAMTAAARISRGDKVLEIGTGSGYQAAVLAFLGARVVSLERNPSLARAAAERLRRLGYDAVEVIVGDGTEGFAPGAPYQAILVTAAAPRLPAPLVEQLADGGRLIIPVGGRSQQDLELVFKHGNETTTQILDPCQFVPLVGRYGWPEYR